jgi:DNA-binding transcriptional ArsR family regulator
MNSRFHTLDSYKVEEALLLLRAIAQPTRVKILNALLKENEITFSQMRDLFPHINKDVLQRQLNLLFAANLIEKEILDKEMTYRIHAERIEHILLLIGDFE